MAFGSEVLRYLPQLISSGVQLAGALGQGSAQRGAIQQAGQITQGATNDAMRVIMALYDQGQQRLAPYANVGAPALDRLQQMVGRTPVPRTVVPTNAMSNIVTGTGTGGYAGQQAVANAARSGNPMQEAAQQAAKKSAIGGAVGGLGVPVALGLGSSAMLGAGPGLGLTLGLGAAAGPIGMGLGLLGSYIASKFGANNPYKAAASRGIDEVSRQIWGTNTPGIPIDQLQSGIVADVRNGTKTVQQGKDEVNGLLNAWVDTMREQGTPDSVLQRSIQTQKQYLQPVQEYFNRMGQQAAAA